MRRSVGTMPERIVAGVWRAALVVAVPIALQAQGTPGIANGGDPPGRVARLSALVGAVTFQTAGSDDWSQPAVNYTVTTGDRLYAPQGSRAELDVGASAVRIGDLTDVTVTNLTDHFAQFGIARGTMRASIYRWVPSDSIELDTPNGALLPLTAGSYRVSVDPNTDVTTVSVESGSLEVTGPGLSRTLRGGQAVQLSGADPIQMTVLSSLASDDFERWAMGRDQRFSSNAPGAQYVSQDMPGWEDLDQYGSWNNDATYGPVWYPSAVAVDWVPYREGHWAWVQPWGWSWVDNAPWGFAPFHYGRWARLDRGWAWLPGPIVRRPVYSPALVVFVNGDSFRDRDYPRMQAWFPLGPREPFFPWYHHSDVYLRNVNYTNIRNVDIDRVIQVRDVETYHWRNRTEAMTAVHEETLRNGSPVGRDVIHLRPEQMAEAHIAPHPSVNPEPRLIGGGAPAPRPPMIPRPAMVGGGDRGDRGGAPLITRNEPPRQNAVVATPARPGRIQPPSSPPYTRPAQPPVETPAQTPASAQRGRDGAHILVRPPNERPIITRSAPPQQPPPAAAQARAMQAHPGRPLEPQQIQTMRTGRPAGPPRDAEVPAHARPVAPAPAPASKPAPPARPPEPSRGPPAKPDKPDRKPPGHG